MACKVALLGFGTVGRSVAKILCELDGAPVRLTHVFNRDVASKRVDWVPGDVRWTERIDEVLEAGVDVVVELIGGLEPTGSWVRRALEAGTSVVTANKPLVAQAGPELAAIGRRTGAQLGIGASVAGGVPILGAIQDGLSADRLIQILGILNGTCNYILTRIEEAGLEFGQALQEAQHLGFAEADPTDDIDGSDARDKLVILARLGLGIDVDRAAVPCLPITGVRRCDFTLAHRHDCTIRQLSRAELGRAAGTLSASVRPAFVLRTSSLAAIQGSQNLVRTRGRYGGLTSFVGLGAGGDPTAVAVASDVLAIARGHGHPSVWPPPPTPARSVDDDFESRHAVRLGQACGSTADRLVQDLAADGFGSIESIDLSAAGAGGVAGLMVPTCRTDRLERALAALDDVAIFPVLES
jgi:homoserine dehydrogenase